jgi:hypothetical protein
MPASTKAYRVTTAFTDPQGRKWQPGEDFKGQAEDKVKAAIAAGQVEEKPAEDAD